MNTNNSNPPVAEVEKARPRWPLKTLIELLPLLIALTAIFSYSTIRNVTNVALITPLNEVLGGVPLWVAGLMGLVALVGLLGMGWLIYLFSRAPVAPDGSDEE
ncbi:MAG: hypothetical protein Fur0044_03660 [Anaerolineae bacterium]|nr:hypothetical protein [Anaerolineales bacterium]MCQ3973889.1 hypothetical protein [Anaerolineae bacterium]